MDKAREASRVRPPTHRTACEPTRCSGGTTHHCCHGAVPLAMRSRMACSRSQRAVRRWTSSPVCCDGACAASPVRFESAPSSLHAVSRLMRPVPGRARSAASLPVQRASRRVHGLSCARVWLTTRTADHGEVAHLEAPDRGVRGGIAHARALRRRHDIRPDQLPRVGPAGDAAQPVRLRASSVRARYLRASAGRGCRCAGSRSSKSASIAASRAVLSWCVRPPQRRWRSRSRATVQPNQESKDPRRSLARESVERPAFRARAAALAKPPPKPLADANASRCRAARAWVQATRHSSQSHSCMVMPSAATGRLVPLPNALVSENHSWRASSRSGRRSSRPRPIRCVFLQPGSLAIHPVGPSHGRSVRALGR
jgi:hypothetical protein